MSEVPLYVETGVRKKGEFITDRIMCTRLTFYEESRESLAFAEAQMAFRSMRGSNQTGVPHLKENAPP